MSRNDLIPVYLLLLLLCACMVVNDLLLSRRVAALEAHRVPPTGESYRPTDVRPELLRWSEMTEEQRAEWLRENGGK